MSGARPIPRLFCGLADAEGTACSWVKQTGHIPVHARTLEARGKLTTPMLRQLMGIEAAYPEGLWSDPAYATSHFRPDLR